jgi:pyroglutamyl-peptidase
MMHGALLLTGFEPFGGERINPSWEVATRLDGRRFGDVTVSALRLPVNCARATQTLVTAINDLRPTAVLGLGQAGGRPAICLEKVALNLLNESPGRENDGGLDGKPVIAGGPNAYFCRLSLKGLLAALHKGGVPALMSLSAGVYICNAVMYVALHTLRERPAAPVGFIHLPYETSQATRRALPSMALDLMVKGVEIVIEMTTARR